MPTRKRAVSARVVVLVVVLAAIAIILWRRSAGPEPQSLVPMPVACSACGYTGQVKVGPTPGAEPWPRECPQCHTKHLYPARPCPYCGKMIPMKDPDAEKLGSPRRCPFCKHEFFEP